MASPLRIPIPVGGRPYGIPPQEIRNDQLADALNVYIEDGALRDRRGFSVFHDSGDIGAENAVDALAYAPATSASGVRSGILAATDGVSTWHHTWGPGASWNTVTPAAALNVQVTIHPDSLGIANSGAGVRAWSFPVGDEQATVINTGVVGSLPHYYAWTDDPTTDNLLPLSNAPTGNRDIISAASRFIAGRVTTTGGSEVAASAVNDMTTWPSGLFALLDDTPDIFIGFSEVDRSSFLTHKMDSQWIAASTPNAAFPFNFEKIGSFPGPMSTRSIVRAGGQSFWIGGDGIIYKLNTTQVSIQDASIAKHLVSTWSTTYRFHFAGAYHRGLQQVWWVFFKTNTGAAVTPSLIVHDIATRTSWIQDISGQVNHFLGWPAVDGHNEDAGILAAGDTAGRHILTLNDGLGYELNAPNDDYSIDRSDGGGVDVDGSVISAFFQTAVRAYAGPQNKTIIRSYQPMFRKEATASNLVTIDFLGGDYPDSLSTLHSVTVDPSDTNRPLIDNLSVEANWVSIKHSWTVETDHGRIWDGGILWVDGIDEGAR